MNTLTSLSSSLGKFTTVGSNIAAINNLSLDTKGNQLINSISTITTAVKGVTTLDAASTGSSS